MPKRVRLLLAALLFPAALSATVAVSGHLINLSNSPIDGSTKRNWVRFELNNCSTDHAYASGAGMLDGYTVDLYPGSNGVVSGVVYGNHEITCAGATNNTTYTVTLFHDGRAQPGAQSYQIGPSGFSFDSPPAPLSQDVVVLAPSAVITNPSGSQAIISPNPTTTPLRFQAANLQSVPVFDALDFSGNTLFRFGPGAFFDIRSGSSPANPAAGYLRFFALSSTLGCIDSTGATCSVGGGISALNGLSASSQTFVVDAIGSDFSIASSIGTHTFHMPSASSSARGLLTATDWTAFNTKQAALGFTAENSANRGQANGYAPLDSSSKVPSGNLPAFNYQTVQANGSAQTQRPAINLISGTNATVSCADNSGSSRTDCTVSASAGAGGYSQLQANGSNVTQRSTENYSSEFAVSDNAGSARTDVSINSVAGAKVSGNISGSSANITGLALVPNGGTGLATLQPHQLYVGNGTSTPTAIGTGVLGQPLISGGPSGDPSYQDPIVSYNYANLINAQAATGQVMGSAVRLSTLSASGTLYITFASITGSPSGCTAQLKNYDSLGNALNNGAAISLTPSNGTTSTLITSAAGLKNAAQISATYACGAYPSAGTVTVDFVPGVTVDVASSALPTGAAQDSTLTGGTVKAINRGGAKGATTAADVTSTASGTDHQAIDAALYDNAGNRMGTSGTPMRTDPTGSTTQPVNGTVTANLGTLNGAAQDSTLTGGTAKAITRGGAKGATSAADVTSTASGADHQAIDAALYDNAGNRMGTSGTPMRTDPTGSTTQPVSVASLPLPTGAAISAKQPALGTAGSPSADVITVQGTGSGTPQQVQDPFVTVLNAADATVTQTVVVRSPNQSGTGQVVLVGAGITGSPSGCQFSVNIQSNLGGTTVSIGTFVYAPATGISVKFFTPTSVQMAEDLQFVYTCVTYPTGGTLNVTFIPSQIVGLWAGTQVSQGGAPWTFNLSQVGGAATATVAAGVARVGIADSSNNAISVSNDNTSSAAGFAVNPGLSATQYPSTLTSGNMARERFGHGLLWVAVQPSLYPAAYAASKDALAPAASATDVFVISGNATNTALITKIKVSCTQTTAGQFDIQILRRSTADTSGTSSSVTAVALDPNSAAASTAVLSYTANPTTGTLVGNIDSYKLGVMAPATSSANDVYIGNFQNKPIVLRGTAQQAVVNFGGSTMTGGSCDITVEWTETTTP